MANKLTTLIGNIMGVGTPAAPVTVERDKVMNRIIERYNYRVRKDIQAWRTALMAAENPQYPRRLLLYNLYADLEIDNHVTALIEHIRKEKLFGQNFKVVDINSGDIDEDLTDFFQSDWFFDFMDYSLQSKWFGHSLIEMGELCDDPITGKKRIDQVQLIPRRHVVPERGMWLVEQFHTTGYIYRGVPDYDYLIEVGKPQDLGLFKKAAPSIITKKNVMMAWSEFCEIFGMPLRVGYTPSSQKEDLDRMATAMQQIGSAAWGVFREGEKIDFIESSKSDSSGIYDGLIERCNNELSKIFAGQTMTHENGSSKAQGQVHENTSDDVTASDMRFIQSIVNGKLLPYLLSRGMAVKGKRFEYPEQKDMEQLFTHTIGFLQKYDIAPEWIEETFGVPVLEIVPPPPPAPILPDPNAPPIEGEPTDPPTTDPAKDDDTPPAQTESEAKKIANLHLAINELYTHDCNAH